MQVDCIKRAHGRRRDHAGDASELHHLGIVLDGAVLGSTRGPFAATIPTCRCGVVRTARHPRPRQRDAGSATVRAPPAGPAATSDEPWPASSAIAALTVSASRSVVTRFDRAGRRRTRRLSTSRPCPASARSGHSSRSRPERPFDRSISSKSNLQRRRPRSRASRWVHRCPRRASPAGASGATPRPDGRSAASAAGARSVRSVHWISPRNPTDWRVASPALPRG